ncbi:MAG: DNA translocase FtsK 4TM domain-containing protein [Ruminococcus sp.]|nr:DNA translocase FtsK 4TM domain-containing protein [Ruminococcus sp.]
MKTTAKKNNSEKEKKTTGGKSAAKKNTSSAKSAGKAKSAAGKAEQTVIDVREKRKPLGIAPYIVVAVALFIVITFFLPDTGIIGPFIKNLMLGLFGAGGYLVPFYMIYLAVFRRRDERNGVANAKIGFAVGSFLALLAIIHLFDPATTATEGTGFLSGLYEQGKQLKGAGAVGSTLGIGLQKLIGHVASVILSVLMAAVLFIFLFGSTPRKVLRYIVELFRAPKAEYVEEYEGVGEPESLPAKPAKPIRPEPVKHENATSSKGRTDYTVPDDVVYAGEGIRSAEKSVKNNEINRDNPFEQPQAKPKEEIGPKESADPTEDYRKIFEEDGEQKIPAPAAVFDEVAETEITKANVAAETGAASAVGVVSGAAAVSVPQKTDDDKPPFEMPGDTYVRPEPEYKPDVPTEELTRRDDGVLEAVTQDMQISDEQPYVFPPVSLLQEDNEENNEESYDIIIETGKKLITVLDSYGVKAKLVSTSRGPTVTRYEVLPDAGVRVNKIANLADDIRMRMAATNIRIETNIPGKSAIGIEIPNKKPGIVRLRTLIDNPLFRDNKSKLFACLGVDVGGNPVYFDIPDMPHLLIAGATGMGKSVCINSIIMSLLYRAKPDEVKLILIDPKKIELAMYNDIPHLSVPVVTEPRKAAGSLNWAVVEMEKRYTLMQEVGGARTLNEYNAMIEGDPERDKLPYIVIVIDELADLIMSAPDEVETSICRLAQKARAAGIYLIIGTQRPTVDVITGLIKANVPSRIAFTVQSQIDSRTIIDTAGAEKLCGKGDMLFAPVKALKPIRVQGSFVDTTEVTAVCTFVRNAAKATYDEEVIKQIEAEAKLCGLKPSQRAKEEAAAAGGGEEKEDPLFLDAIGVAFEFETMSTSLLQRRLSVGYSRAQKMIDMMEARGYVGKFDTQTKKRKIVITFEEYQQLRLNKESAE